MNSRRSAGSGTSVRVSDVGLHTAWAHVNKRKAVCIASSATSKKCNEALIVVPGRRGNLNKMLPGIIHDSMWELSQFGRVEGPGTSKRMLLSSCPGSTTLVACSL